MYLSLMGICVSRHFLASVLILVSISSVRAQDKGEPATVHVREVHRVQDDEATEKGNWYHITAVVETKTVVYSLKCDEFIKAPEYKFTISCFHLSAGKDYDALVSPTAINFWAKGSRAEGTTLAVHEIVSAKEK
jgi:hypothetical protein